MPDIKVRDLNASVVSMLDDIVTKENYQSRNQLLVEILTLYVSSRNDFFLTALPDTVKYLCEDSVKNQTDSIDKSLNLIYNVNLNLMQKLDKLSFVFGEETENPE